MDKFEIEIVNYFDAGECVAEIYYSNCQWVQISHAHEGLTVQFYPHSSKEYWEFPFAEALSTLEQAKNKLLSKIHAKTFLDFKIEPGQINEQAQVILEQILNHPEKVVCERPHLDFEKVIEIVVPGKGGARFTADGKEMIGFIDS